MTREEKIAELGHFRQLVSPFGKEVIDFALSEIRVAEVARRLGVTVRKYAYGHHFGLEQLTSALRDFEDVLAKAEANG